MKRDSQGARRSYADLVERDDESGIAADAGEDVDVLDGLALGGRLGSIMGCDREDADTWFAGPGIGFGEENGDRVESGGRDGDVVGKELGVAVLDVAGRSGGTRDGDGVAEGPGGAGDEASVV